MKVEIKHLLLKSIQLKNAHDTAALNNALLTSIRTSRPASRFHEAIHSGKFPSRYENHFQPSEKNKWRNRQMKKELLHSCPELIDYINEIGFLPLLPMGIPGWSAEECVDEDCQYTALAEGGWEWPLWKWKGAILQESGCAYGKFFDRKAAFISREWWPDFCNYRRSVCPRPAEGSIEESILDILRAEGSLITRELRAACGFTGTKMRSKFDAYLTRLEMGGYIVTEDFVYPHDRHGREYGWGWSLLTTPEALFGKEACHPERTPQESYERLTAHFRKILPDPSGRLYDFLLK